MEWQWIINQGIAVAVVVFVGVLLYRVLVGSEKTGYQGLLVRWAVGVTQRMGKHFEEQTELGRKQQKEHSDEINALTLLVESQTPPVGAAFIAAKAVHQTATEVEQLRDAVVVWMKLCRLIAKKFPDVEAEIDQHCDEIERLVGQKARKVPVK